MVRLESAEFFNPALFRHIALREVAVRHATNYISIEKIASRWSSSTVRLRDDASAQHSSRFRIKNGGLPGGNKFLRPLEYQPITFNF